MTLEYKQSLTEVHTILNFMEKEYVDKLPDKLVEFIKENRDNSYVSDININIPINKQHIKKDTKILLSLIYRNYWCSQEKKQKLMEGSTYLKSEHEKEIREKYNPENIFKSKKQDIIKEDNNIAMVEYKETLFRKIINKIKSIFI